MLLQIPGSILKDGNQIRRLLVLTYVLGGKTVRVLSPDLSGDPSSGFNGLKLLWEEEEEKRRIKIDFVPLSHVEELEQGKADLGNVLKLDLHALPAATGQREAGASPVPGLEAQTKPATPRTIRIFLASSAELQTDRDEFERYFRQQNDQLREEGLYLVVDRWENFLDAMSETRLQDEYNKAVRACDVFVSLFFTKTGKFTEEEFDVAHRQFKETGRPHVYTFFKNANVPMASIDDEVLSLLQFKKKLASLGHFYTGYDNIEHLKRQFRDQLDKLRRQEG